VCYPPGFNYAPSSFNYYPWAILDVPPTNISELINSSFDTRPPLILDFEEHLRGKHV
jgi:hypothetical protein